MLTITSDRLRALVSMDEAIRAVRSAFISLSNGAVDQPQRLAMPDGSLLAMVAGIRQSGTVAKLVSVNGENRKRGLPTIQTLVIWFSPITGEPAAIIEGEVLTSMRTGAACGVATDLLARKDAAVLAMIGAGALAPDQIRAIACVRPLREVRIFSLHTAHSAAMAQMLEPEFPGIMIKPARTSTEAVMNADIVCTATTSVEPVFDDSDLAGDCHINAVGAFRPTMCEVPARTLARAAIVSVDSVGAAMAEAGDIIQAVESGSISQVKLREIGKLLSEGWDREADLITVFKSVGVAAQDWALANLAVNRMLPVAATD